MSGANRASHSIKDVRLAIEAPEPHRVEHALRRPAKLPATLAMLARIDAAFAFDLSPTALSEHGIKARPATLRSVLVAIAHYDGGQALGRP